MTGSRVALDRARAEALDAADPLAEFRERFAGADDGLVYLDGNSLGRLPLTTRARLADEVDVRWGQRLIRGWEEGWMEMPVRIGDALGQACLGAGPGQVVIGDSTTVCFYKLAAAALALRPGRGQIITDRENFPTDRYVLEGLAAAAGREIVWLDVPPDAGVTPELVAPVAGPDTALLAFSHVAYRSGFLADMAAIGRVAHEAGALALWDLSHSVGSVPVALDADGADLAVGCTYKYLNAGPGAPAFMYARRELQDRLRQPIWGWLGRRDPFAMGPGFQVAEGVSGLLSGTPPVLGMACVEEGVALVASAGLEAIRRKGMELTALALTLADAWLAVLGVGVASPRDALRRGAHVALTHPDASRLCRELIARGVIPDFRRPDVIRVGLSPLTTRFVDVWDGLAALRALLDGSDG
ncbi:MAG TPA: kynureninase [Solirubrobacteraceae bacterium]|nr:kynureninase [Solirubrobacteraceae bacterium]